MVLLTTVGVKWCDLKLSALEAASSWGSLRSGSSEKTHQMGCIACSLSSGVSLVLNLVTGQQ